MNLADGILGGHVQGDIAVNIQVDPFSIILIGLMIFLALFFSSLAVKLIA